MSAYLPACLPACVPACMHECIHTSMPTPLAESSRDRCRALQGSLTDVQTKLMGALDAAAAPGEKKDAPPPPSPEKRGAYALPSTTVVCACVGLRVCLCLTCACVRVCASICLCVCVCTCSCLSVHVPVPVCLCLWCPASLGACMPLCVCIRVGIAAAFLAEIAELEGMIEAAFAAEKMPGEEDIVDEDETREEDEADPRRRIERPENIDYKTCVRARAARSCGGVWAE